MITTQIITLNNENTIKKCLESLPDCNIIVADMGSEDKTIEICKSFGAQIFKTNNNNKSQIRNNLTNQSETKVQFMIEPWEFISSGKELLDECNSRIFLIQNDTISKPTRLWLKNNLKFTNKVFEKLEYVSELKKCIICGENQVLPNKFREWLTIWEKEDPSSKFPLYYKAQFELNNGNYDNYINLIENYLFHEKMPTVSVIMSKYYLAKVYAFHKFDTKKAIENLLKCIMVRPLMSEFWCLLGDIYFYNHRLVDHAISYYENAQILGKHRKQDDEYPIEIKKYNTHPTNMISLIKSQVL